MGTTAPLGAWSVAVQSHSAQWSAVWGQLVLRKLAPASPLTLVGFWLQIFYKVSPWEARMWAWGYPAEYHPLSPCQIIPSSHIVRARGVCQGWSVGSARVAFCVSLRVRAWGWEL